jgi:membrane associated rhomboid family serine protease
MLVVPITGKLSWRNPPVLTIALILINCMVFFFIQAGDRQRLVEAERYYLDSGLARIEVPKYITYRHARDRKTRRPATQDLNLRVLAKYHREMEKDYHFLQKLQRGAVITSNDAEYHQWRRLRRTYQSKLDQVVLLQYGFRPAYPKLPTMLTYMFLHGGLLHLLGNMVFLWLIGCALEMGTTRSLYIATYLVGGLVAVMAYWLAHLFFTGPLIGASGAVAALMGAYTVVFGTRRVNIFFSLGFYFNYIRFPAIVLLPVWIGEEIFQLFFSGIEHVAYVAHIGGLASGAVFGLLGRKTIEPALTPAAAPQPEDEIARLLQEAVDRISEIDLPEGRRLLHRIVARDRENVSALTHLFNVEKNMPACERFHATAAALLELLVRRKESWMRAHQIYIEYAAASGGPRLSPRMFLKLGDIFAALGRTDQAGPILTALAGKRRDLHGLPTALLNLAHAFRQKDRRDDYRNVLTLIDTQFPNTPESQSAQIELRQMDR